ncbi:PadR family transcriptional regulator [Pedobacter suwonensis]|uniref:PadR family transcriptional regulator n=1 Tax=Pedobacter suwonensis TaxID=332999 RepID=UPI0036B492BB
MNEDFIHKWISQVKKGTLSFIVLNVLKGGKAYYGYDLINEIKKITEIEIAEGTLYPLMNRLKDEKLIISEWVEQESGIPRKYYSITPEGKNTVTKMAEYWHNLNNAVLKITI